MDSRVLNKSLVVLVADWDTAPAAIRAAGDLLGHWRRGDPSAAEVLGVWCRPHLDRGLPLAPGDGDGAARLGLAGTFGVAGAWALGWIDGPRLRDAPSGDARRLALVDALVAGDGARAVPGTPRAFVPVFDAERTPASIQHGLDRLRGRFPDLVQDTWILDHREHGFLVPEGVR